MTRQLSLPGVTRIEVISPESARAFVGRFPAGASVHVQDEGRTIKVFAGEPQPEADGSLLDLQSAVADTLALAPALLDNPEYGGSLIDAIADHLHRGGFVRTNREG